MMTKVMLLIAVILAIFVGTVSVSGRSLKTVIFGDSVVMDYSQTTTLANQSFLIDQISKVDN